MKKMNHRGTKAQRTAIGNCAFSLIGQFDGFTTASESKEGQIMESFVPSCLSGKKGCSHV